MEYKDGSLQWLENALESEAKALPEVARVKAYCNPNFRVPLERWRTGRSDLDKIVISPGPPSFDTAPARKSSCNTSMPARPA